MVCTHIIFERKCGEKHLTMVFEAGGASELPTFKLVTRA